MSKWTKKKTAITSLEIALILLIAWNMRIIYIQYESGAESIDDMPYAILEVVGGSMEPSLSEGDGVFVYKVAFEKLQVGDNIVFDLDGELVTHQIIDIEDEQIIAQGTANDVADDPITEAEYKGKVIFQIPYLSGILYFYESPTYFIAFASILFLLIFGSDIFAYIYDKKITRKIHRK